MSVGVLDPPDIDERQAVDWDDEIDACRVSPAYFTDQFGLIDKPKRPGSELETQADEIGGGGAGIVPFRLWPAQIGVMDALVRERQVLILKARQLGISWLVCAYVLWLVLFHSNQVVFLYSKGQSEANELLRRIKALYERLPGWMKDRLPKRAGKDNTRELDFSNGSKIKSMPATKSAGISFTASLVVLDEWAHQLWGGHLYEMVKPIMEAGGQMIILSTANGTGNWFHKLWTQAEKRLNNFKAIFLPWWARPGRDRAWYKRVQRDTTDPALVCENYPSNPIEAFRSSGTTRFSYDWIVAQTKNVADSLPQSKWPVSLRGMPGLRIYSLPQPGRRYIIPADVAEGLPTSNFDAAPVIDADSREEVAFLHGRWEPDLYAKWLIEIGYYFNEATIIPERNNHGHAVLLALGKADYPNIGVGHDGNLGWHTNTKTKSEGIDLLAAELRDALITIRSQAALDEMAVYKRLKNGATGAEPPDFDDIVMSWYIGLAYLLNEEARQTKQRATTIRNPFAGYRG